MKQLSNRLVSFELSSNVLIGSAEKAQMAQIKVRCDGVGRGDGGDYTVCVISARNHRSLTRDAASACITSVPTEPKFEHYKPRQVSTIQKLFTSVTIVLARIC
jgi:hypothetical protein